MKEKSLYDAFYADEEKEVYVEPELPPLSKIDGVHYSLNQFRVVKYFLENYPKSDWHIGYAWNPFDLSYSGFGLTVKGKLHNPFTDKDTSDYTLYRELRTQFSNFQFKEEFFDGREYNKEFFLEFLIGIGYEYPADRKLRELMNPFSGEKIVVHYDEINQPYLIVDGKIQYMKKGR